MYHDSPAYPGKCLCGRWGRMSCGPTCWQSWSPRWAGEYPHGARAGGDVAAGWRGRQRKHMHTVGRHLLSTALGCPPALRCRLASGTPSTNCAPWSSWGEPIPFALLSRAVASQWWPRCRVRSGGGSSWPHSRCRWLLSSLRLRVVNLVITPATLRSMQLLDVPHRLLDPHRALHPVHRAGTSCLVS